MPVGKVVRLGVWEDGSFIGCVLFGSGACNNLGGPYGLSSQQCCEMLRLALGPHRTPSSRILAIAVLLLRRHSPGLKAIVSFSDPSAGHLGILYQAGNWIYTGETTPGRVYRLKGSDKIIHSRRVSPNGQKIGFNGNMEKVWRTDQCEVVATPAKHRYVLPLDDATRTVVTRLAKPKPCARGHVS